MQALVEQLILNNFKQLILFNVKDNPMRKALSLTPCTLRKLSLRLNNVLKVIQCSK